MRQLIARLHPTPIAGLALVLSALALSAGLAGCGGNSAPSPEIQQQNFDDEIKAMENAENTGGI